MASITASVFIGVSLDGFIARPNGAFDFLPQGGGEPHGYDEFMETVDVLVIGRKTFQTVLALPEWPYGSKRVVVLSNQVLDVSAAPEGTVEQMAGNPAEIVTKLAARGARHLYIDGGITIQHFLREGLIQRIIITRVPVLIGEGIPLFGALERDIRLRHVATKAYASGLVRLSTKSFRPLESFNSIDEESESKCKRSTNVLELGVLPLLKASFHWNLLSHVPAADDGDWNKLGVSK